MSGREAIILWIGVMLILVGVITATINGESDMKFTEFRSKSLKALWEIHNVEYVARIQAFSVWRIDDICANHWKADSDVSACVDELDHYVRTELLHEVAS